MEKLPAPMTAETIISAVKAVGVSGTIRKTKGGYGYLVQVKGEIYHVRSSHFKEDLARVTDALAFLKMMAEINARLKEVV